MKAIHKLLIVIAAVSLSATGSFAQDSDSPSLGDLARQQRQQREQAKTADAKDAKATKVFTNADLPAQPEQAEPAEAERPDNSPPANETGKANLPVPSGNLQGSEQIKSQIQAQKSQIAELQSQMDDLNSSIRFAPGNCVRNCEQWNERQEQKQQQVERMRAQLDEMKHNLEQMQESARKQGFGSSVYEP